MSKTRLHFVGPMKAAMTAPPPDNGKWLYEVKLDGFRVLAIKNGNEVELWSRNQKPLNQKFPEVVSALARLGTEVLMLDGEVCALDAQGRSSFQLLQNQGETGHPVVFYIFDALFAGKRDLRSLPLHERKTVLGQIMSKAKGPLRPCPVFVEHPKKILETMRAMGAEGAIAKLIDSPYQTGSRSSAWIKIKFHRSQEFIIVGYTEPKRSRKYFGALSLGYYKDKRLIFAGHVGTGFNDKTLKMIYEKMKPLVVDQPLVEEIQEPSGRWRPPGWRASESHWLQPRLIAQVQFAEWTSDGLLRHASFLGLRDDKKPDEVVREGV